MLTVEQIQGLLPSTVMARLSCNYRVSEFSQIKLPCAYARPAAGICAVLIRLISRTSDTGIFLYPINGGPGGVTPLNRF